MLEIKSSDELNIVQVENTQGYDGHCLRAYSYFGTQMPDIINTVDSINSIKKKYPNLRSDSKAPTFLLTYGGTKMGLQTNCGFSPEQAASIEANYHKLYQVSDEWTKAKITQASQDGYATLAFGLRLRTPILKKCLMDTRVTPREAEQEARSAGNAISGQSYGLLNNRAAIAFFRKVRAAGYANDILPVALIHDAIYILVRDDVEILKWANDNLTHEMSWQELPEIQHDVIKLGAELDVFYPSWKESITLPNHASTTEILDIVDAALLEKETK